MKTLFIDIETFSEIDLKKCGAYRYAEDAEILLAAWAWDDDPVNVWDLTDTGPTLDDIQNLIDNADRIVIHNSPFERAVFRGNGVHIPTEKIEDTMVLALAHGLPGKLEQLGPALHLPLDKEKDKAGKKLIQLFTKPRPKNMKLRRATRGTHPDEWARFIEYARQDVVTMRDVYRRTPRWNCSSSERALWLLDQETADRGVRIDLDLARSALRAFEGASRTLATRTAALTGGAIRSATQTQALRAYLLERYGCDMPDMTGDTVDWFLAGENLHPDVRELLTIRAQSAATTPSKYRSLIDACGSDGRLRGVLQFCGAARTGRDAGRIFQPQNLIRTPDWFDGEVQEATIASFKAECEDLLYDNVVDRVSFAVRGSLVAEPGKKLVIADLSNIEGRVNAWLAGEQWKLDAFRSYDAGTGHDLYKVAAGKILGKDPADVTKDERQKLGKVSELAGQFQGALGAYRTMGGAAIEAMSDEEVLAIVKAWRAAHPMIVRLWYNCEAAAKAAIRNVGETYTVGYLTFDSIVDDFGLKWLRMQLPSGRYLCYLEPEGGVVDCGECDGRGVNEDAAGVYQTCGECDGAGSWGTDKITFMGVDQYTRQWKRLDTYGGRLVENATQAVARDVFFHGFRLAMAAGYPIVLRVHDELVAEVPDTDGFTVEELSALMAKNPGWSGGLPLAAAGFECLRYRKG